MRKCLFFNLCVLASFILGCSTECPNVATDPLEAASVFVDGCLKGDFKKASCLMMSDTTNLRLLRQIENDYKQKSDSERRQYAQASIQIENEEAVDEKTHIIYYRNSYDKTARKIKVLQTNDNEWLVDFSYTFNGNL